MHFDEVREYQAGDDVRAIDWNSPPECISPIETVEERELLMQWSISRVSLGSGEQSKRELAAEIASVRRAPFDDDKVGLILYRRG